MVGDVSVDPDLLGTRHVVLELPCTNDHGRELGEQHVGLPPDRLMFRRRVMHPLRRDDSHDDRRNDEHEHRDHPRIPRAVPRFAFIVRSKE